MLFVLFVAGLAIFFDGIILYKSGAFAYYCFSWFL